MLRTGPGTNVMAHRRKEHRNDGDQIHEGSAMGRTGHDDHEDSAVCVRILSEERPWPEEAAGAREAGCIL